MTEPSTSPPSAAAPRAARPAHAARPGPPGHPADRDEPGHPGSGRPAQPPRADDDRGTGEIHGAEAEAAWRTYEARDAASDGRFILAVVTTGIYCRPSCPARRPLRRNVRFFVDPAAAEAAGFRACLRCDPRGARPEPGRRLAEAARAHLEAHLDETVPLARLAAAVGASPWHLQRTFRRIFGQSPARYVNARRLERLRTALREEKDVTTALYAAGFQAPSRLYEQAHARLGMTPGTWRRGGAGARVAFATADSPLAELPGRVLVAATERGVCAVLLGDDDREVEAALRRDLPRAEIVRGGPRLGGWVEEVLRRVAGAAPVAPLPVEVGGTEFQRRVWQALTEIPRGETRSYGEIAARVGTPGAARAVGQACAGNRLAVLVPCHRVVAAGGGPGGYRWGAERKRRLLAGEQAREQDQEQAPEPTGDASGELPGEPLSAAAGAARSRTSDSEG